MKIGVIIHRIGKKIRLGLNRLFILVGYTVTFFLVVVFFRRGLPSAPTRVLVLEHSTDLLDRGSCFETWKLALYRGLTDPYLERIVVHLDTDMSIADVQVFRGLFQKLKAQGKKIVCYAQAIGTLGEVGLSGYYLGSCANQFYLGLCGHILLEGASIERLYFGKCLKNLGIKSNFVAQGEYKSGPDGFTRSNMSVQEKAMMHRILTRWHGQIIKNLIEDRRLKPSVLKAGMIELTCSAQEAKKLGWVD